MKSTEPSPPTKSAYVDTCARRLGRVAEMVRSGNKIAKISTSLLTLSIHSWPGTERDRPAPHVAGFVTDESNWSVILFVY